MDLNIMVSDLEFYHKPFDLTILNSIICTPSHPKIVVMFHFSIVNLTNHWNDISLDQF